MIFLIIFRKYKFYLIALFLVFITGCTTTYLEKGITVTKDITNEMVKVEHYTELESGTQFRGHVNPWGPVLLIFLSHTTPWYTGFHMTHKEVNAKFNPEGTLSNVEEIEGYIDFTFKKSLMLKDAPRLIETNKIIFKIFKLMSEKDIVALLRKRDPYNHIEPEYLRLYTDLSELEFKVFLYTLFTKYGVKDLVFKYCSLKKDDKGVIIEEYRNAYYYHFIKDNERIKINKITFNE